MSGSRPSDYQVLHVLYDSLRKKRLLAHQLRVARAVSTVAARERRTMKNRGISPKLDSNVTIRVSGKLFQGHLPYLEQLVHSATECRLWPQLDLAHLEELDRPALFYLIDGEHRDFSIVFCPRFIRDWIEHERDRAVA
jgi:hypothetical protein